MKSLMKNEGITFHFIAVDDNSTDGTYEWLKSQDYIDTYSGNGSLFYTGGMRIAIEEAKKKDLSEYDYIMFINDDVCFSENSINMLIDFADEKQQDVLIGSTKGNNGKLSYGGIVKTHWFKPSYRVVMSTQDSKVYCDSFCANCVLIPRSVFENLPNMDSAYSHLMGDYDYGFEIKRKGYKIIASSNFVGICNSNDIEDSWQDTSLSRKKRLQLKNHPKVYLLKSGFIILKRITVY